LIEICVLDN